MIIVNTSFSPILYMPESVTDKTPIPITIERRHIDPPGLWIVIVIGSIALHSLLLWLMFSSTLNLVGRRSGARRPIQVVEVVPRANIKAKPRIIAQKPKVQSKLPATAPIQVKPLVKPQSLPQTPNQPVPVQPSQNQASQPGTIAFTNNVPVKKPVNKPPLQKKQPSLPPIKPKVEQKVAIIPPKTEPKKPNIQTKPSQTLAEKLRLQQLAEQRRLQQEAEIRRLQRLAEQQRQQEAEKQRLQKLTEKQRQQKLALQKRQEEIDALAQRQKEEVARYQGEVPTGSGISVPENPSPPFPTETSTPTPTSTPIPTPTSTPIPTSTPTSAPTPTPRPLPTSTPVPAPAKEDSTTATGGFGIVNLTFLTDEEQAVYNRASGGTILEVPPRLQPITKTLIKPKLDEEDKKLVKEPITCAVALGIDANGKIYESQGIIAQSSVPEIKQLCQKYAEKYFSLNEIKFLPGKQKGRPAAGNMLTQITIQPAAPENKNP